MLKQGTGETLPMYLRGWNAGNNTLCSDWSNLTFIDPPKSKEFF
jgi:hypothetical protein